MVNNNRENNKYTASIDELPKRTFVILVVVLHRERKGCENQGDNLFSKRIE